MAQHANPLTGSLGTQSRLVAGSSGRVLGTLEQRKEQANNMARLEGTGVDPRYGAGDIFDVPKYAPSAGDSEERSINPVYQELLDKGFATEVDPKDDPGRTITQIADAKVNRHDPLSDPVDAEIAASMTDAQALAIVHSGDANAEASDDGKPGHVKDAQAEDPHQVQPGKAYLGQPDAPDDGGKNSAKASSGSSSGSGGSGKASTSGSSGGSGSSS